jgi:hypothetical protein
LVRNEFGIRVNGVLIREIAIRSLAADGGQSDERSQLMVRDPDLGWFTIEDEDEDLAAGLARFVLEYRDERAWEEVDPLLRPLSGGEGWRRLTSQELIALLESSSCAGEAKGGKGDAQDIGEENDFLITTAASHLLWQDAGRCFPNEKEIERRAQELFERMEFAAMLRRGSVAMPGGRDFLADSD